MDATMTRPAIDTETAIAAIDTAAARLRLLTPVTSWAEWRAQRRHEPFGAEAAVVDALEALAIARRALTVS